MIEVLLGGENRQLKTNIGSLKNIRAITGKDPFQWVRTFSEPDTDTIAAIETVISAGLGYETVTEDVKKWVDELDGKEALKVITDFINVTFGVEEPKPEPGEVKAPMHK